MAWRTQARIGIRDRGLPVRGSWYLRTLLASLLLTLLPHPGDQTLITRSGERHRGTITRTGDIWVVDAARGSLRFPASQVACVFEDVHEVTLKADQRFGEAKRLYTEAEGLDDRNPARNQKLRLAIEVAQGAAEIYRLLEPHFPGEEHAFMGRNIQLMMQFVRLCRGAASSDIADAAVGVRPEAVALEERAFRFQPPPAPERPWVFGGEFGPGQAAVAEKLRSADAAARLEAVNRLLHPPAPAQLPAVFRLLETETSAEVVQAISDALGFFDTGPVVKSLGWVKREPDPQKRAIAFTALRQAGDKAAGEFLASWLTEAPPPEDADRAQFASAFQHLRATSSPPLLQALTKQKSPKVQSEILKQMGAVGDKAFAPILVKAIPSHTRDAVVSLLKIGKPGLQPVIEGCRSPEQETRKWCTWLCRKITGIEGFNAVRFEQWWVQNRKTVQDEENAWWVQQAAGGFPVDPASFQSYLMTLEELSQQ